MHLMIIVADYFRTVTFFSAFFRVIYYVLLCCSLPQVELAGGKGVKVATILEDPSVKEADMHIYATHTKHFPVRGAGFVSVQDPSKPPTIVIDGISAANYKIQVGSDSSFSFCCCCCSACSWPCSLILLVATFA